MAHDILFGIDLGTSAIKAAAFSAADGRLLEAASVRLPVRAGPDGMREQDLADVDRAVARAAAAVRRRLGGDWSRLAGVGLAAHGGSAILADRASGRALTPMQLWNDARPLALLAGIAARKPAGCWRRLCFLADPGAGLARLTWLRKRHTGLFRGGNLYIGAGEYVYFQLTGAWRQDAGNALQIGCCDARRRRLAEAPLRLVGVDTSMVAPMREGHELHPLSRRGAAMLRLPGGIPVAGPYLDHEAGYLAATAASPHPLQCSLGTAWVGNYMLPPGREPPPGFNLLLPSPVGPGSLVVRVMLAGTMNWEWALGALIGGSADRARVRAESILRARLPPPPGLIALPWLGQPNLLAHDAAGGGGFLGIGAHTTREDLLRALVAGMAYEMMRVFEPVKRSGAVDRAILGGGAAAAVREGVPVHSGAEPGDAGVRPAARAGRPREPGAGAGELVPPHPRARRGAARRDAPGHEEDRARMDPAALPRRRLPGGVLAPGRNAPHRAGAGRPGRGAGRVCAAGGRGMLYDQVADHSRCGNKRGKGDQWRG